MCSLAMLNGCNTEDFLAGNCLIQDFDDGPRYFNKSVHTALRGERQTQCDNLHKMMAARANPLSCAERHRWLRSRGYNLYMNEYTALGGAEDPHHAHPCPNMLTILGLRHPHDRVVSHIRHLFSEYRVWCGPDVAAYFARGHDVGHWTALAPAPTNNYLIRSLLGEAVYNLPLGGVTREHLDLARLRLAQQYEMVMVLEDPELSATALQLGLGWQELWAHKGQARAGTEHGLPENLEPLWALNELDVQLYKFGVAVARLDGVVFDVARAVAGKAVAPVGLPSKENAVEGASPQPAAPRTRVLLSSSTSGCIGERSGGGSGGSALAAHGVSVRAGRTLATAQQSRASASEHGGGMFGGGERAIRGLGEVEHTPVQPKAPTCGWVSEP